MNDFRQVAKDAVACIREIREITDIDANVLAATNLIAANLIADAIRDGALSQFVAEEIAALTDAIRDAEGEFDDDDLV